MRQLPLFRKDFGRIRCGVLFLTKRCFTQKNLLKANLHRSDGASAPSDFSSLGWLKVGGSIEKREWLFKESRWIGVRLENGMIEFKNVSKNYTNNSVALDDINLKIKDGEFVFIVGPSGAGKTTLTKLLLRMENLNRGELLVDGKKVHRMGFFRLPYYRRKIGYVFQDFRLFENMTVYENVAFAMRAVGAGRRKISKKVPLILKVVGLETKRNRFPASLSGGEQQRVALARALANNPRYIVADEPTGNVDWEMSLDIMDMFEKISRMGKTVIVVTHDTELVKKFGKRVITLSKGKIVSDTPALDTKE